MYIWSLCTRIPNAHLYLYVLFLYVKIHLLFRKMFMCVFEYVHVYSIYLFSFDFV